MARSLTFGNGNMLILIDRYARVRDIYFPFVGLENHVGGRYAHRIGCWVDGQFSWFDDGSWVTTVRSDLAYTGLSTVYSHKLGIEIYITDVLDNVKNVLLRKFKVNNKLNRKREIRIFFNHQFEIYNSERGDTAFYDPESGTIIHYEGRRAFLMNARTIDRRFGDYSVGVFELEGKEGTYRDAEDGVLSKNGIEHGRVDSTLGISLDVEGEGVETFHYWLAAGHSIEEVKSIDQYVQSEGPDGVMKASRDYWHAWVERNGWTYYGLGENVIDLFKKSQFYLRSHVDRHGGIIASGDSDMLQGGRDTYAYVWPRDAAYVAVALDWIGDRHSARTFFNFCNTSLTEHGYLMHKYRSDGSLGSSWHGWLVDGKQELPIQEDETALILWALWEHWLSTKDLDFIESIYHSFINKAGNFLSSYRDPYSGLPKPSYNLWEERFAVHTYTACTVYAGLRAAANFAQILGKERTYQSFARYAEEMREAILKHLYNIEDGSFYRSIALDPRNMTVYDRTIDVSSAYGVFIFGVLPADDERMLRAIQVTKDKLSIMTPVGGIVRYQNDQYYRVGQDVPGNPWFITTLWMTQHSIMTAKSDKDLDQARADLNWVERNAVSSGILSEQINPYTREQIGAAPLTWSHAEYIRTVVMYLRKLEELNIASYKK
jgi:GH15 family glucan-1,4-alpha-glucosidase